MKKHATDPQRTPRPAALRRALHRAYDRGDFPAALTLSREMDKLQIDLWKAQTLPSRARTA